MWHELEYKLLIALNMHLVTDVIDLTQYVWAPHVGDSLEGWKIQLDPLKLKLKVFVSCYIGFGNQTQVFWKTNIAFNL